MELTHTYKSKHTVTNLSTPFWHYLSDFVNSHEEAFKALCRQGTPFGGSVLPADRDAGSAQPSEALRRQVVDVQQQVDSLNQTVAQLSDRIHSIQPASRPTAHQVGINRFRALGNVR